MIRPIITIDDSRCNGCGECLPNCPEGALQLIDGKARLVSDLACDGLGACLGHCPQGAIRVERREAAPYDETVVIATIVAQGPNTLQAHLEHLASHGQSEYLAQALQWLGAHGVTVPPAFQAAPSASCPGARARQFVPIQTPAAAAAGSALTHWPVQLHLVSPTAPAYRDADVLLAADCVAYAVGDFHTRWLVGRALAIACPKLDEGQEVYREKLRIMIDDAGIRSLTVAIMEVPCCGGLLRLARAAIGAARRPIPLRLVVVSTRGEIQRDEALA
jgi:NAD-dependent dihydropyrimidine dehydrogenase PreA subunit